MSHSARFFAPVSLFLTIMMGLSLGMPARAADGVPKGVTVRSGYALSLACDSIRNARFMEFAPDGTLYVSTPDWGQIKALRGLSKDGVYEQVTTFVTGHPTVHGLFWHEGWLWFTQSDAVFRAQDTNGDGKAERTEKILSGLPHGGHWWRSVLILGGRLYTGIGDSENISDESKTKREKVWSYKLDGSGERLFCSGLRNTEKLVVRPGTSEIWGMDHGSDWFGRALEEKEVGAGQPITDLNPPDEMNHLVEGGFYGHPFLVGNRVPRYEYMDRKDIARLAARTIAPEWCTHAHWAPNAMEFYTASQFPGAKGDAFVAYHGSWNSSKPVGYCVSRILFENGKPYGEQVYVSFLSKDGDVLGRPVDCAQAPDGSLLISDDKGNKIYRLRYVGK